MYKLRLTARAKKELKEISHSHQLALGRVFEEIKEDPLIGKALKRELAGRYSYRVSVYRVIYTVNASDKVIYILTAGHRSSIYE